MQTQKHVKDQATPDLFRAIKDNIEISMPGKSEALAALCEISQRYDARLQDLRLQTYDTCGTYSDGSAKGERETCERRGIYHREVVELWIARAQPGKVRTASAAYSRAKHSAFHFRVSLEERSSEVTRDSRRFCVDIKTFRAASFLAAYAQAAEWVAGK